MGRLLQLKKMLDLRHGIFYDTRRFDGRSRRTKGKVCKNFSVNELREIYGRTEGKRIIFLQLVGKVRIELSTRLPGLTDLH